MGASGMAAVTLKDVAQRAGVSRAAVSRTFTPGASVSAKTRAKVQLAAEALGYSPNMLARSLITRKTQLIGLVSNNFHNPVFLQIFDLFTRALQEAGLRPLLVNLSDETDPARSVQLLRAYSVDGVIVASSHVTDGFAQAFADAGLPVVHAFGRPLPSPRSNGGPVQGVHVVAIDNIAAGQMAAATLIARGYRRLGFLGGPQGASTTQDRLAGFTEGARGLDVQISFADSYSFDAGHREMTRLMQNAAATPLAQAYFCADDVLSIGALSALQGAGLAVPQDIGIIGLNDMDMAAWANINLTTIHQPFDAIVRSSIALIRASLDQPDVAPQTKLFECHIVERGSLRAQL
jgi:DNA-binding LacI/PurR family transcriptional regulator